MVYQFPPDVAQLIRLQMASGQYASEDDLLREALQLLSQFTVSAADKETEYRDTVAAVREGIADVEAGRMRTLRGVIKEARKE